jgi:hypothetical protein
MSGCGTNSAITTITPPIQDVAITAQPLSQVVPIGEAATFSVTATGTAPLSYQWSENGVAILGANDATYTTPTVAFGGVGSTLIGSYQVVVSNLSSYVASNTATLIAGPRSPKPGDLRYLLFQQVTLPGLTQGEYDGGPGSIFADEGQSETKVIGNAIGTPLSLGSTDACSSTTCAWLYFSDSLPSPMTGLDMYYTAGDYSTFASDMQKVWYFGATRMEPIDSPNNVITSLDMEPGVFVDTGGYVVTGAYGISVVATEPPGGFDYRLEVIPPAQLQATAAADGAASRVITAASFDASGNANLISYGWTGDTTSEYETQAYLVAPSAIASTATNLAGDGYIISAFGGNDTIGYMLVGMRVKGDSLPRPVCVYLGVSTTSSTPCPAYSGVYETSVVNYLDDTGSDVHVIEQ